eukprot:2673884-Rhodomonas_salina.1
MANADASAPPSPTKMANVDASAPSSPALGGSAGERQSQKLLTRVTFKVDCQAGICSGARARGRQSVGGSSHYMARAVLSTGWAMTCTPVRWTTRMPTCHRYSRVPRSTQWLRARGCTGDCERTKREKESASGVSGLLPASGLASRLSGLTGGGGGPRDSEPLGCSQLPDSHTQPCVLLTCYGQSTRRLHGYPGSLGAVEAHAVEAKRAGDSADQRVPIPAPHVLSTGSGTGLVAGIKRRASASVNQTQARIPRFGVRGKSGGGGSGCWGGS